MKDYTTKNEAPKQLKTPGQNKATQRVETLAQNKAEGKMEMPAQEDTRNLVDRFKGMANTDIIRALDKERLPLEVAIENLSHDFNIGTIIRNANAFNLAKVHIVGKHKYNRRGAMVTDKYMHLDFFACAEDFVKDAHQRGYKVIAIENNRPRSRALSEMKKVKNSILVFGSESDGLSKAMAELADEMYFIEQLGSTRSINVGCASAVALYQAAKLLGAF